MDTQTLRYLLQGRDRSLIGEQNAFKSAVLIPLIQVNGEWSILFEVRSLELRSQPGDICFPGGRIEATDESPEAAAVRETSEELGLAFDHIDVLGPLEKYVPSSEFIVYPYVAILPNLEELHIQKSEVAAVFTVPLKWLTKHEPIEHHVHMTMSPPPNFPYELIPNGKNYKWRKRHIVELFYQYQNHTIWGMTARILQHFLSLIKS